MISCIIQVLFIAFHTTIKVACTTMEYHNKCTPSSQLNEMDILLSEAKVEENENYGELETHEQAEVNNDSIIDCIIESANIMMVANMIHLRSQIDDIMEIVHYEPPKNQVLRDIRTKTDKDVFLTDLKMFFKVVDDIAKAPHVSDPATVTEYFDEYIQEIYDCIIEMSENDVEVPLQNNEHIDILRSNISNYRIILNDTENERKLDQRQVRCKNYLSVALCKAKALKLSEIWQIKLLRKYQEDKDEFEKIMNGIIKPVSFKEGGLMRNKVLAGVEKNLLRIEEMQSSDYRVFTFISRLCFNYEKNILQRNFPDVLKWALENRGKHNNTISLQRITLLGRLSPMYSFLKYIYDSIRDLKSDPDWNFSEFICTAFENITDQYN